MATTERPVPADEDSWLRRPARTALAARRALVNAPRKPTVWVMFGLTAISFLQRPGRTTFDTKLDLAVDPAAFLGRALHLWNPQAFSGELQNQAYGYFFPMGPFFAGCDVIGISPWIAQRLWCALLLCVAFGGVLALTRALRIGTESARFVGALAYTLAPRMLTEIGPVSAEMLPAVMLPWVLVPLVRAGRIGSPRRAAGLSALAVLCMGGVNGALVIMALVLPVLWLLTRRWTRAHVKLVLWWCGSVLAACLWWILPLLLLGEYSLPFVDYVESASNTTAPTSLFQVLRGANQWVAYVVQGTPWLPAGFLLVDNPLLMLATGLVAAIGVSGLVRRQLPERLFLTIGVLSGVTLLTVGYVGSLNSPLAEGVRQLLDGPLAPLRNVHKFEPGLRLALIMAFVHAVSGQLPGLARVSSVRWASRARVAVALVVVLAAAAPAWLLTLRPGPGWDEIPGYWRSATAWLGDADRQARTLLLPATGFGDYTWGHTIDEPAQALARSPWALRSQSPLGSEGNTRVMDAVEETLANGRGSPGLADFLARSGYRFLLMRNDIDRLATGSPPITVLRAGLAGSPGIVRVATFGPKVTPGELPVVSSVDLAAAAAPALEIFEVRRPVPRVSAVSSEDVATVSGGPESLLPLLESGLLKEAQPTVLAGDGGAADAKTWLVTDGLRYRERNLGRVRNNLSQTLTSDEQPRQQRPSIDVLPFQGVDHQTIAAYRGIRTVNASSSASFADTFWETDPSLLPFAAIDGDPATAWRSSSIAGPSGQWLEVGLDTPRAVYDVTLRMIDDIRVGWPVTRIRITTDTGSVDHDVARGSAQQGFATSPGITGKIRVTVLSVAANRQNGNVGIAELSVPGVNPQRALQVAGDVKPTHGQQTGFSFTRGAQPRYACVFEAGKQRCDANLARFGEEPAGIHRLFRTASEGNYRVGGTVLPSPDGRNPVAVRGLEVSSSTQLAGDPAAGPLAAVDGNPDTTWISDITDLRPTLRLKWSGPRELTGLRVVTDQASGAAQPAEVILRAPDGNRTVALDANGSANLNLTTDQIEISLTKTVRPNGTDGPDSTRQHAPEGISELQLSGVDDLMSPLPLDTTFSVPCGMGPNIRIDGFDYATSVSGTLTDFSQHRPLPLITCTDLQAGLDLTAGEHEVRTDRSSSFVVQDLWLRQTNASDTGVRHRELSVRQWDVTHRAIEVGAGDRAVLSVPENANTGWVATLDGRPLERTRVDGWQQAWLLPAGDGGTVRLDFVPGTGYRMRLLVGALAVVALLVATALPVRRRTTIMVSPGGWRWVPVALIGLLAVLGGALPVVLLIGCLLARTLWRPAPRVIAIGGMVTACVVAVAGRLAGHGQEWAYGWVSQAALLLSIAAVVSTCVNWFDAGKNTPEKQVPPARGEVPGANPA